MAASLSKLLQHRQQWSTEDGITSYEYQDAGNAAVLVDQKAPVGQQTRTLSKSFFVSVARFAACGDVPLLFGRVVNPDRGSAGCLVVSCSGGRKRLPPEAVHWGTA